MRRKVAVVIKELAIDILINTMVRPQPVRIGGTRLMSCSHAQVPTDPWFRVAGLNPSFCQVSLAGGYPGARIGRAPHRTPLTWHGSAGTTGTKLVNYVVSDRVVR